MKVSIEDVKVILSSVLSVDDYLSSINDETRLLGSIPDFDSMSVMSVLILIEEKYYITIDMESLTAEHFYTVGGLRNLINMCIQDNTSA